MLPLLRTAADVLAVQADRRPSRRCAGPTPRSRAAGPHEEAEEAELLPALARTFGSSEAIAPMSRAHAEIGGSPDACTPTSTHRRRRRLDPEQAEDLLACLYGLHTLLELHFVQEEESYFALDPDLTERGAGHLRG